MTITSLSFILFLLGALAVYYILPGRAQAYWLLLLSYGFCITWAWQFAVTLLLLTGANFSLARRLRVDNEGRRGLLWLGLALNLSALVFFRTANFFLPETLDLLASKGWAADRVLRGGLETFMVGLDVTRRMIMSAREVEVLASTDDRLAHWLGEALTFYVEFHRGQEGLDGCVVNDPLTLGELIEPGLLTLVSTPVEIDLDEGEHRGHTKEREHGVPTAVAMEVDVSRMRKILNRVFGDGWQIPAAKGTA